MTALISACCHAFIRTEANLHKSKSHLLKRNETKSTVSRVSKSRRTRVSKLLQFQSPVILKSFFKETRTGDRSTRSRMKEKKKKKKKKRKVGAKMTLNR